MVPLPPPGKQNRQVFVVVAIAVAETASVADHRVIEHGSVAFGDRLEPFQQIGQLLDMKAIDPTDLGVFGRITAVMQ